jgi:hypothetical protein
MMRTTFFLSISIADHIAKDMPFPSDASLRSESSTRRWQPDGPEGQQLKTDVFSIFHDGSLDVDNPDYMLLSQKLPLYS